MARTSFSAVPLGRFGALIEGLDLSETPGSQEIHDLRKALAAYQLLLFRGQVITPGAQLRLTGYLGKLDPGISRRPAAHQVVGYPDLLYVRNTPGSPTLDYGSAWHSDGLAYARVPHGATVLRCMECPPGVGDTLFANQYAAYQAVPAGLRQSLAGAYWYLPRIPYSEVPAGKGLAQPLFRKHAETGATFVYHSPQASRIQGMSEGDSAAALGVVHGCQVRADLIYRHSWQSGDVVVWENCTLLHNRADVVDYAVHGLRAMHRSATSGQFEAVECELPG